MLKCIFEKLIFIVKKIIFSSLIIYMYNVIVYPTFNIIPINIFAILIIMLFGFPGMIWLALFYDFIL